MTNNFESKNKKASRKQIQNAENRWPDVEVVDIGKQS